MLIINLTQHAATPEQVAAGVVDLQGEELAVLKKALTFESLPSEEKILRRAEFIAELAVQNGLGPDYGDDPIPDAAMIGGAPYLMGSLERALSNRYIRPLYAFSTREVEEQIQPDGSVKKVAVFRHKGFVEAVEVAK
ncbi:MAG: hypothetical protein ACUVWY_15215 [Desulfosoma sp.]|uniref:hypothetical protein n=1 Tax=Desulfosoma sp. TaxID=2603217 RepID=UPI00404AA0DD